MSSGTLITDYLGSGVIASRPATPPVPSGGSAFYYATDTTTLYAWSGSTWITVTTGSGGGGVPFHPGFAANRFYTNLGYTVTTSALGVNTLSAVPFYVPTATTFTKAAIQVSTAIASSQIELGVYANSNGLPSTLVADFGQVSAATTGFKTITGLSVALPAGWYWLVCAASITGTQVQAVSGVAGVFTLGQPITGLFSTFAANITATWTYSTGNLPSTFPTVAYAANANPIIGLAL